MNARQTQNEPATMPMRPIGSGPRIALPARYEDLGEFAHGGWGEVRRVRDRVLDRVVVMKILSAPHRHPREAETMRSRFMNEARVTASLEHPGIVPVHDRGVLDDGRPWFTMKEVRGRTLKHLVYDEPRDEESARRLRRLVEIVLRVAETAGYAHERGVIHRDIKPSNVMIGEFGEVLLLDWGIARAPRIDEPEEGGGLALVDAALTSTGDILGTVAYMSPEQGRGIGEPLTAASDVFCIGVVLQEALTGERARPGDHVQAWAMAATGSLPRITPSRDAPEELCAIVARATALDPDQRPADGGALASLLRAWLDGSMRRERAAALVAHANTAIGRVDPLRRARDLRRAEARAALAGVRDFDPVALKLPAWQREDEARAIEQQIDLLETEHVETLRAALELDPDHEAAHDALAALYRARVLDRERHHAEAEAARAELLLRRHDRGSHTRFLRGLGRLVLASDPTRVEVRASRYVVRERQRVPDAPRSLGFTPIDVELEAGSWLIELVRDDGSVTRLPIRIARDETWTATRPGESTPRAVRCLGALGPGEVHVPAGLAVVGGDPQAAEPVPEASVWIDDFVIRRVAVTFEDYLAFLDDLAPADAHRHAPRWQLATAHDPSNARAVAQIGGRWAVALPGEGNVPIEPTWPVTSIDWRSARAYAEWLARRTGLPWRLPDELEIEKAARGADARAYPWGDFCEPTWARIVGSTPDVPSRVAVGIHPVDQSPYGVRDLAGNARTWCAGPWTPDGPPIDDGVLRRIACDDADPAMRAIRGGSWSSVAMTARAASRFAGRPDECFAAVGIRLVRSV